MEKIINVLVVYSKYPILVETILFSRIVLHYIIYKKHYSDTKQLKNRKSIELHLRYCAFVS